MEAVTIHLSRQNLAVDHHWQRDIHVRLGLRRGRSGCLAKLRGQILGHDAAGGLGELGQFPNLKLERIGKTRRPRQTQLPFSRLGGVGDFNPECDLFGDGGVRLPVGSQLNQLVPNFIQQFLVGGRPNRVGAAGRPRPGEGPQPASHRTGLPLLQLPEFFAQIIELLLRQGPGMVHHFQLDIIARNQGVVCRRQILAPDRHCERSAPAPPGGIDIADSGRVCPTATFAAIPNRARLRKRPAVGAILRLPNHEHKTDEESDTRAFMTLPPSAAVT
jgi:hypothetical protein